MASNELIARLNQVVERMPAFPKSVQAVLTLTRRMDCEARDIVAAIERDPVMTVKLLKVINSAFYALPRKVSAVDQAVALLGINTIKNMALAFAASGMLPERNEAGFDVSDYLAHSLGTAELARVLCRRVPGADANDAYVVGLLHDFGKIVFAQGMGTEFRQALAMAQSQGLALVQAERSVMGIDHTVAGGLLAERWQFPPEVVRCIRQHHPSAQAEAPHPYSNPLDRVLFLANQLSRHLQLGHAGSPVVAPWPDDWPAEWVGASGPRPGGQGADGRPTSIWDQLAQTPGVEGALAQARQFAAAATAVGEPV